MYEVVAPCGYQPVVLSSAAVNRRSFVNGGTGGATEKPAWSAAERTDATPTVGSAELSFAARAVQGDVVSLRLSVLDSFVGPARTTGTAIRARKESFIVVDIE